MLAILLLVACEWDPTGEHAAAVRARCVDDTWTVTVWTLAMATDVEVGPRDAPSVLLEPVEPIPAFACDGPMQFDPQATPIMQGWQTTARTGCDDPTWGGHLDWMRVDWRHGTRNRLSWDQCDPVGFDGVLDTADTGF